MVVTPHPELDDFPRLTGQEALWPYLLASALLFVLGLYLIITPGTTGPRAARDRAPVERLGLNAPQPGAKGKRTLRLGFLPGATFERTLQELAADLEQRTEGRIELLPMPGFSLEGRTLGELELVNLVSLGRLEMALCTTAPLSNYNSRFEVLELPFLLETYEQADRLLDGPLAERLNQGLERHQLRGLGYLEIGFRIISSRVPMPGVDDFRGQRLRVMESRTSLHLARALGAEGVACPPDRVYAMSRDKTIEGSDRTLPSYWASRLYEVQPYITETRHMYSAKAILINELAYDSLTPEDQTSLSQAVEQAEKGHRQRQRAEEEEVRRRCQERGITLFTLSPAEREKFRQLCQPLYEEFEQSGETGLLQEIRALTGNGTVRH
ncbi:TRAP transporter substrate-binding protein [bacterium CPR1]|nr:TRAP transporter substrate-binding protein [bacterium CPR1]